VKKRIDVLRNALPSIFENSDVGVYSAKLVAYCAGLLKDGLDC
jgi:hypothetical protein